MLNGTGLEQKITGSITTANLANLKGTSFDITYNGETKTITFDEDITTNKELQDFLTKEIDNLSRHIIENKKDNSGKRGLQRKVSARKALLAYLERKDIKRYRDIITKLNLRGIGTVEETPRTVKE